MTKTALIFPGQGAFYAGALRSPRLAYAGVDQILGVVDAVARRRLGLPFPAPVEAAGAFHASS